MTDWKPTKLRDFFLHFDPENQNHLEAADLLQKHANALMNDEAEWVKTYRGSRKDESYMGIASEIIEKFEGFRANPYKCAAGVWTIGYGTTYYPNGELVQPWDKPVSKELAEEFLKNHIKNAIVPVLERSVPTWGLMNPNQKASIISFAYNLGAHFYGNGEFNTITKALSKKENWNQVPAAMMLYRNPGSSFEAGLKRRREAEGELWKKTLNT